MPRYVLGDIHPAVSGLTADDEAASQRETATVIQEMKDTGVWLYDIDLEDAYEATVVTSHDDTIAVVEGPHADSRDYIGALTVIKAPNLDAAIAWAARLSRARHHSIEVRKAPTDSPRE